MTDEEMMDKMDAVAQATLTNLYTLTKNSSYIILKDFDLKNKEHLFFFRIAMIAKDVFNKQIVLQCGWFKWLWAKWKFRKLCGFGRIKEDMPNAVSVPEVLEFTRPVMDAVFEDHIGYDVIYDAFYTVGKEKYND